MSKEEIVHAYRRLYRASLQAVCYSQPASTLARDQLRRAFREQGATFNDRAIRRTVWFLRNAARDRGLEHKIVRNMLLTQWWRVRNSRKLWKTIAVGNFSKQPDVIGDTAYAHYDKTIDMLNRSMGICLPAR